MVSFGQIQDGIEVEEYVSAALHIGLQGIDGGLQVIALGAADDDNVAFLRDFGLLDQ